MFITLEGIDGSGKTTAAPLVQKLLAGAGYSVVLTKTPGGTDKAGTAVRNVLLNPEFTISKKAYPFFFWADMIHLQGEIQETVAKGDLVLCDRFKDSTWVYQIQTNPIWQPEERKQLLAMMNQFILTPDLTFIYDVPVEVAQTRLDTGEFGKKDVFENHPKPIWQARRDAYLQMPEIFSHRDFVILNTDGYAPEEIATNTATIIRDRIQKKEAA